MRFEILGPLAVRRDDRSVTPSGPRRRALLAVLLATAPEPVPISRLTRIIWADGEPVTGAALKMTVSRLRRWGKEHGWGSAIERVGAAYRLTLDNATLDSVIFRSRIAAAEELPETFVVERRDMALQALVHCRGPVLADLPDSVRADPSVAELSRSYAKVVHRLTEDCLATDQPELALPHLELVRLDRPDDERIAADLAVALAAAGRQAQGLAVLDKLTRKLAEELGVSPGPLIGAARLRVLGAGRPQPARSRPAQPGSPDPSILADRFHRPPAQLPPNVYGFTGRRRELALLDALVDRTDAPPGAVAISVLSGMTGVGKTALAVHWAHRVQNRFPDGQLYVDLSGFESAGSPTSPSAVLGDFLDALGIPAMRLPAGLQARTCLYRTMLAERKVLVVLDNACDADHVRPLLPASRGCVVVVTSRSQLVELVAAEGARPITLDPLDPAEAQDLLTHRLGADRLRREPSGMAQLIEKCAGLPQALVLAAARLGTNPNLALADGL